VYESETRRNTADQVADYANYWLIPPKNEQKEVFEEIIKVVILEDLRMVNSFWAINWVIYSLENGSRV
jgi:hypothetical protein